MKLTKEFKAGLIVIITFCSFWYLFQFFKGKDIFHSYNTYYILVNEVSGLEKSKPVTINGLKVGKVEEIEPIIKSKFNVSFKVSFRVDKSFFIPINSIAEIYEFGLMSGKEIRILLGNSKQFLKKNQQIAGKIKESFVSGFENKILPLKKNFSNVLGTLDNTLLATQKTLISSGEVFDYENKKNIRLVLFNLNKTVINFYQLCQSLNQVLSDNNSGLVSIIEQTKHIMKSSQETIQKFGKIANQIEQFKIEKTLISFDKNLNNLNKILEKVNSNKGSLGKMLNDSRLYDNLNTTSKTLDTLLKDFKKNPKRYVHFSIFGKKNKSQSISKEENLKK